MAPTVHFIRHAQGYHNLSVANHRILDATLTDLGKEQCRKLSETFPYNDKVDLVVASPLRRTIYTALYSFPKWEKPIITLPELQETSDAPCDTGSDKADLEREFQNYNIDLSRVVEGWNSKTGRWATTRSALEARALQARQWLMDREEENIVVVTHGAILHFLTEDWSDDNQLQGTGWSNTEYRSYTFDPESGSRCSLVETEESRARRRGDEKPLTKEERMNLRRTAEADEKDATKQQAAENVVRQAELQHERSEERSSPMRMMAKV